MIQTRADIGMPVRRIRVRIALALTGALGIVFAVTGLSWAPNS